MTFEMKLTRADLDALTTEELEAAYDEAQANKGRVWNAEMWDYVDMLGDALFNRPCPWDDEEDEAAHAAM